MTGSYRKLGLALAALCLTAPAVWAQDLKASFSQVIASLDQGHDAEAARQLQKILSSNPSQQDVFALWQTTSHDEWLQILRGPTDVHLAGRRLMALIQAERQARKNDSAAINELLAKIGSDDASERATAIRELANNHGEYAAPALIHWVSDSGNSERQALAVDALIRMGPSVVLPVAEALSAEDNFLRREAARVLGRIGDRRAAGALAAMLAVESESGAQSQARGALEAMGVKGSAVDELCRIGELYHLRSSDVLAAELWSEVTWSWTGGRLVSAATPRTLYPDAMARKCYELALKIDGNSAAAAAGLARAHAGTIASVEAAAMINADVAELQPAADLAHIHLSVLGPRAADAALAASLARGDSSTSVVLARALAEMSASTAAAPALKSALATRDGAVMAEAAIALGNMATWGKGAADAATLDALSAVTAREIVRVGFVVDPDAKRADALSKSLGGLKMAVTSASDGLMGLSMLRRMPGVDAVVIADSLPDITVHQLLEELRSEPSFASVAVFIVSEQPEAAQSAFDGLNVTVLPSAADVAPVEAALAGGANNERARAEGLAGQAGMLLAQLAGNGAQLSPAAVGNVANALGRSDAVAMAAAYTLASAGNANHVAALAAVVSDGARSAEVREAAGHALASIFGRGAPAGDAAAALTAVVGSDAPLVVRKAAAQALGNSLGGKERLELTLGAGKTQG
ncbi:MAG: HEAT repeat domain-containing protein [Planctomycetes bacterium]|nr:HEAT repeat domain-containing protein [Planctomycetota bacterium]